LGLRTIIDIATATSIDDTEKLAAPAASSLFYERGVVYE
jgi:hypothetical protein